MPESREAPMSGVLRVVYFLAIASVAVTAVVMAITAFYDPPADEFGFSGGFGTSFVPDDQANYNRNVSLIFAAVSIGSLVLALVMDIRFNALRAGLLLGGLVLFYISMGYAAGGSDQWVAFITAALTFALLAAGFAVLGERSPFAHNPARVHPAFAEPPEQTPSEPGNTSLDAPNDDDLS